jgi:hypothetical protein
MSHRAWASACMVAGLVAVAWMRPIAVKGQTATAGKTTPAPQTKSVAKPWTPPRTPWGDPDLQGVYTRMHFVEGAVPFERPPELAGRTELTEEELQARMAARDKAEKVGLARATGTSFDDEISPYLKPSRQTSVVVDPPDGRVPPYTPEGQKRAAATAARRRPADGLSYGPENFSNSDRCITHGFPTIMNPATPTSNGMQLMQGPGYVAMHFELMNEYRIIPLDGRQPLSPKLRQWWGQSRGHWEGNTLVVEVTNFNGRSDFRGTGENLRVVERFTPLSHGEIDYTYTIDDPTTFTKPWTIKASWGRHDQLEITEYACNPGNRDLPKMIKIAQAEAEQRSKQPKEAAPKDPEPRY